MTGEKRTETRMRCYNTLCIPYPYISLHYPPYTMHAGRGGVIYREYTECYSISFLFLFFFHQSSLYPIKIFAKCFYLLVYKNYTRVWLYRVLSQWKCLITNYNIRKFWFIGTWKRTRMRYIQRLSRAWPNSEFARTPPSLWQPVSPTYVHQSKSGWKFKYTCSYNIL